MGLQRQEKFKLNYLKWVRKNVAKYAKNITNFIITVILFLFLLTSVLIFFIAPSFDVDRINDEWLNSTNSFQWPLPSRSLLSSFEKAAITCDNALCSEIGRDVMMKGGNAIDAAIASLFCLGVTNPQSSGIGGGLIMTLYNRTTKSCRVIDALETAPATASPYMYFNDSTSSKFGWRSIATPGELAGMWLAYRHHGSGQIDWRNLVMPSVTLARDGFPVSEFLAKVLQVKQAELVTHSEEWINPATKSVYKHAEILKRKKFANTLETIANSKNPVEIFYKGRIANIIAAEFSKFGAIVTKKDLINYKPRIYNTPILTDPVLNKLVMCGPPPPSSFAITQSIIQVGMKTYGNFTSDDNPLEILYSSAYFYHDFIESQKFAFAHRNLLGDAAFVPLADKVARDLATNDYSEWIYLRQKGTAQSANYYGHYNTTLPNNHGTSHVSVIDADGNGVSVTSTINRWFGATVQSPELGIIWNDVMDDFSKPNIFDKNKFKQFKPNCIEPGKRPLTSMSPMVIYDILSGKLVMVIGASGGNKIVTSIAKTVLRVLCFNETIKEAIDSPSLHNQFIPDVTQYEATVPKKLVEKLIKNHRQKMKPSTGVEGVVQGIYVDEDDVIWANSDFRKQTDMSPQGF